MKPYFLSKICLGREIFSKVYCIGVLIYIFCEIKNGEIKLQKWKDVRSTGKNPKK